MHNYFLKFPKLHKMYMFTQTQCEKERSARDDVYGHDAIRKVFKYCYCARSFLGTKVVHKKDITTTQKPACPVTNNQSKVRCGKPRAPVMLKQLTIYLEAEKGFHLQINI